MNASLNETETPTETEKRIGNMPIETETQAAAKADYISVADITADTSTETYSAGNDNDSANDEIRATLNKHLDEGKASHQEGDTDTTCPKVADESFVSSTDEAKDEPEATPDIETQIKRGLDEVSKSLQACQTNILKAEQYLARVNEYKHQDVYMAFRDMAFFACDCTDNMDVAAELFGKEWESHRPRKCPSQDYLQAINYACSHSGIIREELMGRGEKSKHANIAMHIHQQVRDGYITKKNFIRKVCRNYGGIDGYYKNAIKNNAKKVVKNKAKAGGKAMSGAEANQQFTDAFNSLKGNQSTKENDNDAPRLVSVVLDLNKVGSFASVATVRQRFDDPKFGVVAIEEITEELLEQILEGGDVDA